MKTIKILVMSDIHSCVDGAYQILDENRDSDVIVFLGDGERRFEVCMAECDLDICGNENLSVYQVAGNCDFASTEQTMIFAEIEGHRFCISHGHGNSVKSRAGIFSLSQTAAAAHCDIALFGHTHRSMHEKISGVDMFNPGAVQNGEYGIITICDGNMEFAHRKI